VVWERGCCRRTSAFVGIADGLAGENIVLEASLPEARDA
jgi:hypothetical protein